MPESATIFIPDISGYTDFVTRTELEHGAFILNNLLQAIVESVGDNFVVSEIEGDAVLLYRKGEPPTKKEMIEQCVKTFTAFHKAIREIGVFTLCQCGACQGASNLTLKFIVHFGAIAEINVSRFTKASGVDMVIAHRLLKNSITEHEYVLTTNNYLQNVSDSSETHDLQWNEAKEEYPSIGVVEFNFASLVSVKEKIPQADGVITASIPANLDQSFMTEAEINADYVFVHECLIDFTKRRNFLTGYLRGEGDEMLHLGAKHTCIFEDMKVTIEPMHLDSAHGEIAYDEFASSPETGYYALYKFRIIPLGKNETRLIAIISPQPGHTFPPALLAAIPAEWKEGTRKMKEYCEQAMAS